MKRLASLILLAAISLAPQTAWGQEGLKIFISADMEGLVGAVTGDQLGPSGFEYNKFREIMTREVNAAIAAARAAGATEFVVADSHGNGENLLLDLLPQDILLVRSWPRPLGMMHGIDETFDGAILIGYHASTTNTEGVRAHTFSSGNYAAVRLNGVEVPEAVVSAAIAGHFGVPVIMISGDDAIVEEARSHLGDIEGAVLKWSHSFHSATTLMPEAAYRLIGEKVTAAMARIDDFEPYVPDAPIRLEITFKNYQPSQILSYLSIVDRVDSHTVGFTGEDMVEVSKFIQFVGGYRADITP
jgi:D-amino peptidase